MPRLRVAGFNYLNNPAGTGGEEFDAAENGDEGDAVWYQVDRAVAYEAMFGEDIRKAYLGAEHRNSLDAVGVIYSTQEAVRACGMSSYVLWLKG